MGGTVILAGKVSMSFFFFLAFCAILLARVAISTRRRLDSLAARASPPLRDISDRVMVVMPAWCATAGKVNA